jgi:sialate O-acetylesterase
VRSHAERYCPGYHPLFSFHFHRNRQSGDLASPGRCANKNCNVHRDHLRRPRTIPECPDTLNRIVPCIRKKLRTSKRFGHLTIRFSRYLLLAVSVIPVLSAEVRLPQLISEHAVLQREAPIHLWGWSQAKEKVRVEFHSQKRSAVANEHGEWELWLSPESAGGPFTLRVAGESGAPIIYNDILVGDVWFASGQSNMEMPLKGFNPGTLVKNGAAELAAANLPQVRLLSVAKKTSNFPVDDVSGNWSLCTPETAADFSAVAYFFGRDIQQKEHVPIGLIDSTWGGTPIEAWTSMDALTADPVLMPVFATWSHLADEQTGVAAMVAEEKLEDAAAERDHQPKPQHPWHLFSESWGPAQLYNGMIAPATRYGIKGVIWYQGESNAPPSRAPLYNRLFSTMISDWRFDWKRGDFPFLFVQISSYGSTIDSWGVLRDQQRRTLSVANTAMAVTIDVGDPDNVHPADKETVGARLALAAEAMVYLRGHGTEYSGPLYRQMTREGSSVRLYFDHAGSELHARGGKLLGFELAGKDHNFVPASAVIEGQTVVVSSPQVTDPVSVRYGWQNMTDGNLYNTANLPASTFTSE